MPPKRATRAAPASTAPEPMQTRRGARGRRQTEPFPDANGYDSRMATRTRSGKPSSSAPLKNRYSLTQDPVARRGAPGGAVEVRSDPRDGSEDEEDEHYEEEAANLVEEQGESEGDEQAGADEQGEEEEDEHQDDADASAAPDEAEVAAEISEEDIQFMSAHVVKVAGTAEGIINAYKPFSSKENIARRTFEMELAGLGPMRQFFIVQKGYGEFLQWTWLRGRSDLTVEHKAGFKTALILINLATALEVIYTGAKNNLNEASAADLRALEILDNNFEDLILASDRPVTQPIFDTALSIRVARLLVKLADASTNHDARKFIYEIFCGKIKNPTKRQINSYPANRNKDLTEEEIRDLIIMDWIDEALKDGPYKAVAGLSSEEVHRRCRSHVSIFLKQINKNKANFNNLTSFRKKYPAQALLASIQSLYNDLAQPMTEASPEPEVAKGDEEEEFHDAADNIYDSSSEDEVESQAIVRATDTQAGVSHFTSAADLQALARSRPSAPAPPPSNQQASSSRGGRGTLPVNHNATPLASPSSRRRPLVSGPHSSPSHLPSRSNHKRTNSHVDYDYVPAAGGADDDDDDDDVFETDTRRLSEAARLAKRQRVDAEHAAHVERRLRAQQAQQQIQHSSPHYPPLSSATTAVGGLTQRPEPTPPDLRAIEAEKRRISLARGRDAAAAAPSSSAVTQAPSRIAAALSKGRKRYAWTDHDSRVLVDRIAVRFGKWASIEKEDNHLFEHPRDQQAYRDRARNMKVDYLITDARLPPGFNFVNLGAKEKLRVVEFGKNPYRNEADVDMATGLVTNTAFEPEGL